MNTFRLGSTGWILLALAALSACEGHIEGRAGSRALAPGAPGQPGDGQARAEPGTGSATPDCTSVASGAPLAARLRRLTPGEYVNSLGALLPGAELPAIAFPPDAALGSFHNAAALLRVTDLLANGLADAAQKLAASATRDLPALLGCDPAQADELGCVRGFLTSFGARAYRRPLSDAELQRLIAVYTQGRGTDVQTGVALALEVLLQSPHLLYRTELGAREASEPEVKLTGPELGSELSFLLTLGPPDAELSRAATAGELTSDDQREAQARRLLKELGARYAMTAFAGEWLDIEKLPALSKDLAMFPTFSAELAKSQLEQTRQHFADAIFAGDGKLRSLLLGGLLLEPSVLAAHAGSQWSSPTHRGKLIRNQFLCQQVAPPPPGLIVTVPPATPGVTTRQRMLTHTTDAACGGCHSQMDPLGFAFEHYDAVGSYRADEAGLTIDASGEVQNGGDADGSFDGAESLSQRLAESSEVRACFAKQWTTFALGSEVDDALWCSLGSAFDDFRAERLSLTELLVRVVRSPAFVTRRAGGS